MFDRRWSLDEGPLRSHAVNALPWRDRSALRPSGGFNLVGRCGLHWRPLRWGRCECHAALPQAAFHSRRSTSTYAARRRSRKRSFKRGAAYGSVGRPICQSVAPILLVD